MQWMNVVGVAFGNLSDRRHLNIRGSFIGPEKKNILDVQIPSSGKLHHFNWKEVWSSHSQSVWSYKFDHNQTQKLTRQKQLNS